MEVDLWTRRIASLRDGGGGFGMIEDLGWGRPVDAKNRVPTDGVKVGWMVDLGGD